MCLKISLTARAIWFSFTVKLLIGPEKVNNLFKGFSKEIAPGKNVKFRVIGHWTIKIKLSIRWIKNSGYFYLN